MLQFLAIDACSTATTQAPNAAPSATNSQNSIFDAQTRGIQPQPQVEGKRIRSLIRVVPH
jgi:hypothetical protein